MITLKDIEKEFGQPAENWAGQCYAVACAAAKVMNRQGCQGAVPIYGHYQGEVHASSMFAGKGPIQQHGWVLMKNGDVVDPTRWAFEGREPYIYNGPNDIYDEGGNAFRMARLGPPPDFDPDGSSGKIIDILPHFRTTAAWKFVSELLDLERDRPWTFDAKGYDFGHVTVQQLFWLANYDPRGMQGHATEVFAVFTQIDLKGFIPLDNSRMVEQGRI